MIGSVNKFNSPSSNKAKICFHYDDKQSYQEISVDGKPNLIAVMDYKYGRLEPFEEIDRQILNAGLTQKGKLTAITILLRDFPPKTDYSNESVEVSTISLNADGIPSCTAYTLYCEEEQFTGTVGRYFIDIRRGFYEIYW